MIHDVRQHNSFHLCTYLYLLLHVRAGTESLPSMVQVRLTELSPRSAREVEGAMDANVR